ncbi:class I lanthipeptide [Flavobacterium supellecticarium]|uniref:class I lanthipeptide n=1 Tax=Flavobacterium supellecticarium TaxID=2565924 RepID=UPI001454B8F3|nr:class I lanthipeptide [Flavobacterium supellecticarium]
MKTQNTNKLAFAKSAIVELNDDHLRNVNGGSLLTVAITVAISVAVGYTVEQMLD